MIPRPPRPTRTYTLVPDTTLFRSTLDPHHTVARFALSHFGFSTFHGQFGATSGTATLDLAKKGGGVDVSIDVRSIATGVDKLDAHLLGADFFDAAKYPTIT